MNNSEVAIQGKKKTVIQAEDAAHNAEIAKADKSAKTKSKPKTEETSPFPAEAEINDYGFLHFCKRWLENLGWANGMKLKVDKNVDGSITLRKV